MWFNKEIRCAERSPKWRTVRKKFLLEHNKCEACGTTKDLEIHHIVPVHIDPTLELEESNLITLCSKSCHLLFGHFMDWKSHNPQVEKDCLMLRDKIRNRPYDKSI